MTIVTDAPWRTDRPLDEGMVREIVRAQFPAVRASAIRAIGDGWDFDVYEIDRRWVFRFPKRREYDAEVPSRIRHRGLCVLVGELYYARLRRYDRYAAFCEGRLHRAFSHR